MPAIPVPVPNSTTVRPCSKEALASAQSASSSEPRHTCVGAWVTIGDDLMHADKQTHIQEEARVTGMDVPQTRKKKADSFPLREYLIWRQTA